MCYSHGHNKKKKDGGHALGGKRALCALPRYRRAGVTIARKAATCVAASAFSIAALLVSGATVSAQDSPRAILGLGNAVVTGFSGVRAPVPPLPPQVDPIERTFIDLDRPSARVIHLDALPGQPAGQLVAAPKPFSITAAQVGQVFSIALDDATPPNIYLAATSAYGLPIVVPDRDGDGRPDRARRGGANANFMPGLFAPVTVNGGPGSIWKIDGRTGAVTLFANVMLDATPNSGPALGGLAFHSGSRQLFVADRDTGMIHRFGLDGADRGRFDHGTAGLRAAALPPVPFDPRKRLDLTSPAFDSGDAETWAYAPPQRRVFALAVHSGRLFYSVAANLQIWSVSIAPDGGFGADPRLELTVPRGLSVAEISNIVFDDQGYMIVAERGAPTGAYDYAALAVSGENRVLRFRPKLPNDPPSPALWHPVPEEYAVGFPPNFRNDNGGIALGYGYDAGGNISRTVCGGTLWSTGEQLRNARDAVIIQRLRPAGPLAVNGLQANAVALVRSQNEPPFQSYFIDYDDRFDDPAARGHLGDVEIWRVCARAAEPLLPVPVPVAPALVCPAGWLNVGGECVTGQTCPAGTALEDGCCVYKECPPSYVSIGGRCVPPPVICKVGETYANGRCIPAVCPPGLVVTPPYVTPGGGSGSLEDVKRVLKGGGATNGLVTNGQATGELRPLCPDGKPAVDGRCPPAGDDGKKMCAGASYCACPDGSRPDQNGNCVRTPPPDSTLCPAPPLRIVDGKCCAPPRGPLPSPTLECYSKPAGMGCSFFDLEVDATTCCASTTADCPSPPPPDRALCPVPPFTLVGGNCCTGARTGFPNLALTCFSKLAGGTCGPEALPVNATTCCGPAGFCPTPPGDVCPQGLQAVCRGEGPLKACSCEPEKTVDQCPAGTIRQCTGTDPKLTCKCVPSQTGTPTPDKCAFPNVQVGDVCCKRADFERGLCGGEPPPLRTIVQPSPPPGAQLGYCPRPFRMVGTSCCNLLAAGQCYLQTGGIACQPGYNSVGEGLSAQCCRQSAVKCTRRSANASCASGEIPVEWQGADPACCREDPAGSCTPPSTPTPNPPTGTGGSRSLPPPEICLVAPASVLCLIAWVDKFLPDHANQCQRSTDCPSFAVCVDGRCVEQGAPQPNAVPASTACQPPSTLVNGQCCKPEAVAAGTCGASPLACTGGKVLVSNVCRCPVGTTENTKSGKCETPKPAATKTKAPVKTPTKPREIVCQKGFQLEGNRCVQDPQPQAVPGLDIRFGIGIGGGGRGGRPGGGAPPKPPAPN
jgi:hypothetical protein